MIRTLATFPIVFFFAFLGFGDAFWYVQSVHYWKVRKNLGRIFKLGSLYASVGALSASGFVGMALAPTRVPEVYAAAPVCLGLSLLYFRRISNALPPMEITILNRLYKSIVIFSITAVLASPLIAGVYFEEWSLLFLWLLIPVPVSWLFRQNVSQSLDSTRDLPSANTDAKNVIFCMIDDLRRDRTSLHGYHRDTTPFVEHLVEEYDPLVFNNCISPSTRSGHSIPSLLSGTSASVHEFCANIDGVRILSDEFRDSGYRTAGLSTNPHMTTGVFDDRFDWFAHFNTGTKYVFDIQRLLVTGLNKLGIRHVPAHRFMREASFFHEVSAEFMREQAAEDNPFFLYISYLDVHEPYVREFDKVRQFARDHGESVTRGEWMTKTDASRKALWYDDAIKNWGYDELVRYTDSELSNLYSFLERTGLKEDTIIVLTSDHGELLGERGYWGHIDVPFDPLIEVPLLIDAPGIDGGDVDDVVSGTQIPSLLFDLLDVQPSEEMVAQWISTLELNQVMNNESSGIALVDFFSNELNTKGYPHPITDDVIERQSDTLKTQRMLVSESWKLLQVDDQRYFFDSSDSFLDDPVSRDTVPDEIQSKLVDSMDSYSKIFEKHEPTGGNYYDELTDDAVRSQLEDLGYL